MSQGATSTDGKNGATGTDARDVPINDEVDDLGSNNSAQLAANDYDWISTLETIKVQDEEGSTKPATLSLEERMKVGNITLDMILEAKDWNPSLLLPSITAANNEVRNSLRQSYPHFLCDIIHINKTDVDTPEIVRVLIDELKFDVNFISKDPNYPYPPLHQAILCGTESTFLEILRFPEVDLSLKNGHGKNAVEFAFETERFSFMTILVVDYFAELKDIDLLNVRNNGFTQLYALLYTLGHRIDFEAVHKRFPDSGETRFIDEQDNSYSDSVANEWKELEEWVKRVHHGTVQNLKTLTAVEIRKSIKSKEVLEQFITSCNWSADIIDALYLRHVEPKTSFAEVRLYDQTIYDDLHEPLDGMSDEELYYDDYSDLEQYGSDDDYY